MSQRYLILNLLLTLTVHAQIIGGRGGRGGIAGAVGGPQQPPPASDCAASGTVVNSVTGEPIPHAMVTLAGSDGAGSATDSTGHWSISNTMCGQRYPNATHAGFLGQNPIGNSRPAQPVFLTSGSPVTGVKIQLLPEATITGTVRDADGEPVDGAQIRALRVTVRAGERILAQNGGTPVDSTGNFRITRLMPGRYILCATSGQMTFPVGGGETLVYPESCFPGPATSGTSNAMQVEAGRESRVSFTLTAGRGVHVRGAVSGGPPVTEGPPFTQVQLMSTQNGGNGHFGRIMPDGTFDIASVPPGAYVARVNFRVQQPGPNSGPGPIADAPVEVGNSDVNNVSLTVRPFGSLSGTVRYELTAAATPVTAGAPALASPMVNVNLGPPATDPSGNVFFSGPIPQAKWDSAHQSFEFNPVPAGQYRLNANLNGNSGNYIKSVTVRGQDALNHPIPVDGVTGPAEIVVSDDVGGIDATVNDADGHPAPGSVMLLSTTGRRVILNAGDDGHATRKTVPTGEYKAWAFDNIATVPYADDQWMNQNAGAGERVTIATAGSATITLKRQAAPPE